MSSFELTRALPQTLQSALPSAETIEAELLLPVMTRSAHVLERIAAHPSNRIDELLPWAVASELRALWGTVEETAKAA